MEIKETLREMGENLKRRIESRGDKVEEIFKAQSTWRTKQTRGGVLSHLM
jgi:hypothetical protein